MKSLLRVLVFTAISLYTAQYFIGPFSFDSQITILLLVISVSLLNFLIKPALSIVSMPTKGLGFLFFDFVLTFAILYVSTIYMPGFSIKAVNLPSLIISGFVLPSKDLTGLWSGVFSALMISIVYTFLEGLCSKK